MKQSGFLKKQEQQKEELLNKGQGIIIQYMVDTLQMTLWTEYGWEYDSIMALTEAWRVMRKEHKEALEPHNAMADVKQEHMQRVFRDICASKEVEPLSFEDRYPYLTKIRYDKKYK
jgi:hypothetical protein